MNIISPAKAASNRTARLVAEAKRPVFSTETAQANRDRLFEIEELACTDEWCHICSRSKDHRGEHDDDQLFAWAKRPGLLQSLLK